ncbi:MAG: response regulator [Chromatiales bacterium]|nr:response regulator [Chromatiales bacterium]
MPQTEIPILIVDDDPTQRMMLRQVLQKDGHRVVEAEDGERGIERFVEHQPLLAIVDVVMPGMDGYELCERLLSMEGGGDLTVMMATSLSDDEDILRAFKAGAADYIPKPINWTVLKERVRHLVQGKLAERMMREAEEQLRLSQKMSAIGTLSSGIAHEFNNILASIMGYTELVQEHLESSGAERPIYYASEVYNSALRARDLVHEMQLFSQTKPGERQSLHPKLLVKENLKMIRSSLPSSINLLVDIEEELPTIETDPAQFQQLLTNLVINARDAIEDRGIIDVSLRRVQIDNGSCDSCHHKFIGSYTQLMVSDNGSGIVPETLEKIFEPYFTTKPVGRGTGMGLSVVHGIMHEIGGHIRVRTTRGEGTSVSLLFPVKSGVEYEESQMTIAQDDIGSGRTHRLLLVDDEVAITGFLSELLEMKGYQVTVSNDSQQALSLFLSEPDSYDLVITDMTLPELSGIDLASGLLQARPDLPVILCSGYIDEEMQHRIDASGIRESFNKPVDSRRLLQSVDQHLRAS